MKFYTGQISKIKKHPNFLDITIKSGLKEFAPTWKMVMNFKNDKITQEEYVKQYYELMRISWIRNKEFWINILQKDEIVLGCYFKLG